MNYLCFDIGGTATKFGILNDNYEIIHKGLYLTEASLGGKHILNSVLKKAEELIKDYKVSGVAISTCGVVDCDKGAIHYASDIVPGYTGINFKKEFKEKFDLNCEVENDVNAFSLSEKIKYPNDDYLMITVGTGIGGGIVANNKLLHGFSLTAGEFGNMIIDDSFLSWEKLASMTSLVNRAIEANLPIKNGKELFQLYDQGNECAKRVVNEFYKKLAIGICNLAYVLNPKYIFIGGGISNRKTFIDELMTQINQIKNPAYFGATQVLTCSYQNDGGLIGALVNYISRA